MKRIQLLAVAMAACALAPAVEAGPPVQDMSSTSIGVDYSGVWRGANITTRDIPAHESVQHVNIRYAPVPYLLLSAGIGAANISVDTCRQVQFKGGYNFSPSLGIGLFTPAFIKKKVRLTAGAKAHYLYTKSPDKEFLYCGPVVVPNGGLVFSLGDYVDIEAGGRGVFLFGKMQEGTLDALPFSNGKQIRGYLSVTLHTPAEGAYLAFDFDASEAVSMNWTDGPVESSVGVSVGIILRQPKDRASQKQKDYNDYPGYKEMEKKMEEMEKEMK